MSLEEFIFNRPAQIALLGVQFQWTADTQARRGKGRGCRGAHLRALRGGPRLPRVRCSGNIIPPLPLNPPPTPPQSPPSPCRPHPKAALAAAKTDKSIMVKNMKKAEALLRRVFWALDLVAGFRTEVEALLRRASGVWWLGSGRRRRPLLRRGSTPTRGAQGLKFSGLRVSPRVPPVWIRLRPCSGEGLGPSCGGCDLGFAGWHARRVQGLGFRPASPANGNGGRPPLPCLHLVPFHHN